MLKSIRLATLVALLVFLSSFYSPAVFAKQSWGHWVRELRAEAISQGIRPEVFEHAFKGVKPRPRVVSLDRNQPERRLTYIQYRKTRIDPYRITLGIREFRRNRVLLDEIGQHYGVDPYVIVAIWGLETSYGRYMGSFPVIGALATLAYDGRRSAFFRKELLIALHILNDEHVNVTKLKGEWAGASGHPQFLPSSWKRYAVDHDSDGKKDIWNSKQDALASIANYLSTNGWKKGLPTSIPVDVPSSFNQSLMGKKIKKTVAEWKALGVQAQNGYHLPEGDMSASVIEPYGGPHFMIFRNFKVLQSYNPSIFYVNSVNYLARRINQGVERARHKKS